MHKLIKGLLVMALISLTPKVSEASKQDEAAIKTIVKSVATLADSGNFEALEKLYAPEVRVDYSALTGDEAELKSPQKLMSEWAAVLPGFDRTYHKLDSLHLKINKDRAVATANVTADHYVNDLYWQVTGDYVYNLIKDNGRWLITGHRFNLHVEEGTRDVFAAAMENAKANPSSYLVRQQTQQTVRDFLEALEDKDMDRFTTLWAEDAVQDMPYSSEGFPKRVAGRDNLIKHYSGWPEASGDNSDFTSALVFYPMIDPEMVFAEFKGSVDIVSTGRPYKQTYGGLFHIENGKIKLLREYYDPAPFAYAFGIGE